MASDPTPALPESLWILWAPYTDTIALVHGTEQDRTVLCRAKDETPDGLLLREINARYNTHAALVAERNAYRKSLEQAVVWARAKCERIGVAEEAWLEDARALLRGDVK